MEVYSKTIPLDNEREIVIETGRFAKQADGAVVVRMGDTMLLATVVSAKEAKPDMDFMPLQVEYQEKFSAIGRFPGGFLKREGRPSNHEILVARLVDRVLRPLFPEDYHAETFVTIQLISGDKNELPDALAGLAASAALAVSDIPFKGPISEVRVSRVNGEFVVNPTKDALDNADIDLMVGATAENLMMVEGEMQEVQEAEMVEALKIGHEAIKEHCRVQKELRDEVNPGVREYEEEAEDEEIRKMVEEQLMDSLLDIAQNPTDKQERTKAFDELLEHFKENLPELEEEEEAAKREQLVDKYFEEVKKDAVRQVVLNEGKRLDGRTPEEIRPIWNEVDFLPAAHGSAVFTRGETQALTSVTLGSKLDEQIVDEVLLQGSDKFLLHYNFPPYSTGDAKPRRGVSRREVGHGHLAQRALKRLMPDEEDNPYTIRVVSDILESNGSSSMATVCAGTMALMDAGVKLEKPISGIAMGLIKDKDSDNYAILSDILGDEDHLGDMDFKVAGSYDGITATQMDIKMEGLSYDFLEKALEQARKGRLHILDRITETIEKPRADYKPHVPRIINKTIPKEMIGALIGPGGKIIQKIQEETNTEIAVEEEDGRGLISILANNKQDIESAEAWIDGIVAQPELGKTYKGMVKSVVSFGAFVEILPNRQGLLHISEIEHGRINSVEDVLKEGDEVEVKLIDIDEASGKLKLSRKALLPNDKKQGNKPGSNKPPQRNKNKRRD